MVDEHFDRLYQESRGELNAALLNSFARFGRLVGRAFVVLNRTEYSAPWNPDHERVGTS